MAAPKKINPNAQAPNLIKKVKDRFDLTQDDLALNLGMSQQAVSDYEAGYVWKERYDVMTTLKDIVLGKIAPKKAAQPSHSAAALQAAGGGDSVESRITKGIVGGISDLETKAKARTGKRTSGASATRGTKKSDRQ